MGDTQVNVFIGATTPLTIKQVEGVGTVLVRKDDEPGTALFLANDKPGKAGALAVLARLTAAVEALPDDTHAGQGVLPTETLTRFCKYGDTIQKPCTHAECRPEYVPALLGALDRSIQQARADRAAPVWRTLTFGDLRAGDVIKSDENGLQGTVIELGGIIAGSDGKERWVRSSIGGSYPRSGNPVLVRHPRPEVGQ